MTVDIRAWLVVSQAPGVGTIKLHKLLKEVGQPEIIIKAPTPKLRKVGLDDKAIHFLREPPAEKIDPTLAWAEAPSHSVRTLYCPQYPEKLKELKDAPPLIYVKGNESLLKEPQIAVIGSRRPTPGGLATARDFSQGLVESGLLINSGMASGIDAVAHEAALSGGGTTVAVIATGPDKIYPAKNKQLAENIAKHGVLVSEFPVGTEPVRANFPRRNRIISGLSLGVVVIEAGLRSGALITARLAAEQGKDVFAVPGSIRNPNTRGCHYLIQQGAKLVEKTEDILVELQLELTRCVHKSEDKEHQETRLNAGQRQAELSEVDTKVLESMGYDPIDIDTLAKRCDLPVQTVSVALLSLEVNNYVGEDNGIYTRVR